MLVAIFLFALGLVVGSFLGAFTYRFPRGISIISGYQGRSICPRCKRKIRWYDNIPIFSFLILKGRCRDCKEKISLREPAIELATGIIFVVGPLNALFPLFIFLIVACLLISIAVIDLENQIIPDEIVWLGLLFLISWYLVIDFHSLFPYLITGFGSALFLLLVNLITRGRGMGLGDVKLAIFVGSMLDLKLGIIWMLTSFVVGSLMGIILIMLGKANLKAKVPFAPFLIIGFFITVFFGTQLANLLLPI